MKVGVVARAQGGPWSRANIRAALLLLGDTVIPPRFVRHWPDYRHNSSPTFRLIRHADFVLTAAIPSQESKDRFLLSFGITREKGDFGKEAVPH